MISDLLPFLHTRTHCFIGLLLINHYLANISLLAWRNSTRIYLLYCVFAESERTLHYDLWTRDTFCVKAYFMKIQISLTISGRLDIMFVSWGCKGDRNSTVERAPQPRTSQHKRTALCLRFRSVTWFTVRLLIGHVCTVGQYTRIGLLVIWDSVEHRSLTGGPRSGSGPKSRPTRTRTYSQNIRLWSKTWRGASISTGAAFVVFTVVVVETHRPIACELSHPTWYRSANQVW